MSSIVDPNEIVYQGVGERLDTTLGPGRHAGCSTVDPVDTGDRHTPRQDRDGSISYVTHRKEDQGSGVSSGTRTLRGRVGRRSLGS